MTDSLAPFATFGIGSVPYQENQNSCETIFKEWDIPFWPQYPMRSPRENFIFQFLNRFPGLTFSESKAFFNEEEFLRKEKIYEENLDRAFLKKDFLDFEPSSKFALGYFQMKKVLEKGAYPEKRFLKLQVTGPATVWKSFFAERVSKSYASRIQAMIQRALTAAGLAQIQRIRILQRVPLIFIDEPVSSDNLQGLIEMTATFKASGALVGLHRCSCFDWKGFENLKLDFFHFDASRPFPVGEGRLSLLQAWIKKKVWLGWGVVPTFPFPDFEPRDFSSFFLDQCRRLSEGKAPVESILSRSLISPACGTGTLSSLQDQKIGESIRMTARSLRSSRGG